MDEFLLISSLSSSSLNKRSEGGLEDDNPDDKRRKKRRADGDPDDDDDEDDDDEEEDDDEDEDNFIPPSTGSPTTSDVPSTTESEKNYELSEESQKMIEKYGWDDDVWDEKFDAIVEWINVNVDKGQSEDEVNQRIDWTNNLERTYRWFNILYEMYSGDSDMDQEDAEQKMSEGLQNWVWDQMLG